MNQLIDLLKQCDIITILTIGVSFVIFNNMMNKKFDKIDEKFDKINEKFEKVDNQLKELRTSLNRMEGAFYSKDCCMLKNDSTKERAE